MKWSDPHRSFLLLLQIRRSRQSVHSAVNGQHFVGGHGELDRLRFRPLVVAALRGVGGGAGVDGVARGGVRIVDGGHARVALLCFMTKVV